MGVGGEVQLSFFGSFSSGGGADGSYAAWPGEYAPVEGVESAPKLLGEDDACPAPSKLVGEYCVGGRRVRFRSAARETSPEQQLVAPSVLSRSDRQTIGKGRPWSDAAAHRGRRGAVGRAPAGAQRVSKGTNTSIATSIHTAASGTRRTDKVDAEGRTSVSTLGSCVQINS